MKVSLLVALLLLQLTAVSSYAPRVAPGVGHATSSSPRNHDVRTASASVRPLQLRSDPWSSSHQQERRWRRQKQQRGDMQMVAATTARSPPRVIIAGAPAAGKGASLSSPLPSSPRLSFAAFMRPSVPFLRHTMRNDQVGLWPGAPVYRRHLARGGAGGDAAGCEGERLHGYVHTCAPYVTWVCAGLLMPFLYFTFIRRWPARAGRAHN